MLLQLVLQGGTMHHLMAWFLRALFIIACGALASCGNFGSSVETPAATTSQSSSSTPLDTKKFWDERDRAAPGAR